MALHIYAKAGVPQVKSFGLQSPASGHRLYGLLLVAGG
jgi:hypothetical protein